MDTELLQQAVDRLSANLSSCSTLVHDTQKTLRTFLEDGASWRMRVKRLRSEYEDLKEQIDELEQRKEAAERENEDDYAERMQQAIDQLEEKKDTIQDERRYAQEKMRECEEDVKETRERQEKNHELCLKYAEMLDDCGAGLEQAGVSEQAGASHFHGFSRERKYGRGAAFKAGNDLIAKAREARVSARKAHEAAEKFRQLVQETQVSKDNIGCWETIPGGCSMESALSRCNPQYDRISPEWTKNCQRCVPAYEMLRRGYSVTARGKDFQMDAIANMASLVWDGAEIHHVNSNSAMEISKAMREWGDGARAQISIRRANGPGHTFIAEQVQGRTVFADPQTGRIYSMDAFRTLHAVEERTEFFRIDQLQPTERILECCVAT